MATKTKSSLFSAIAALLLSGIAIGTAIAPASVAFAATPAADLARG